MSEAPRYEEGQIRLIESKCGVRQGDPLGPLLFSLGLQGLLTKVGADYPGVTIFAYLDDVYVVTASTETAENILQQLSDPTFNDTGLKVNPNKSWISTTEDLMNDGREALGSYIGGPDSLDNKATQLLADAVTRLKERTDLISGLDAQTQLILLRLCFFPQLNHLLRTLVPQVTQQGAHDFDVTVQSVLKRLLKTEFGDLEREISHLPVRMGGLGLVNQEQQRFASSGASYLISQSTLINRDYDVSEALDAVLNDSILLCTEATGKPASAIISDTPSRLQCLVSEFLHERKWRHVFNDLLGPRRKVQQVLLLQNATKIGRGWLHTIPFLGTALDDEQTRYALRKTLLRRPHAYDPNDPCTNCGVDGIDDLHHLTCTGEAANVLRRTRHDDVRNIIIACIKIVQPARQELREGDNPNRRYHDIVTRSFMAHCQRCIIDVGVAAPKAQDLATLQWPTSEEVEDIVKKSLQGLGPQTDDLGDTEEAEEIMSDGRGYRRLETMMSVKFREMAMRIVTARLTGGYARAKIAKYQPIVRAAAGGPGLEFVPFVLSTGGCLCSDGQSWIRDFCKVAFENLPFKTRLEFVHSLTRRISIQLVKSNAKAARDLGYALYR